MKIDLHCHSYYSKDGISSPRKLLETALKKGLDGIALTDHNTAAGWQEAKKAAQNLKAVLILGQEIKTKRKGRIIGDILGIFLKEEIKSREPLAVMKEIKNQSGIVIIPHPFHFPLHFKDNLEKYLNLIDGIEVFNARMPFSFFDKKAFQFAKKYNLAMISSSDAHYHREIGNGFISFPTKNLEELKMAIWEKKIKIEGKKSSPFSLIFPMMARMGLKEKILES